MLDKPPAPRRRPLPRLLALLARHASILAALCLLAGLLAFPALPWLEKHISFDEKPLMAGLAVNRAGQVGQPALRAAAAFANTSAALHGTPALRQHVRAALEALGLDVSEHQFEPPPGGTVAASHSSARLACTNLHAVLRSKRGDGREALLLATPLALSPRGAAAPPRRQQQLQQSAGGAALALGAGHLFMDYLRRVQWLAKDLIWLIPDAACGLQASADAWMAHYDGTGAPTLLPSPPAGSGKAAAAAASSGNSSSTSAAGGRFVRAGMVQQALVLEVRSGTVRSAEIAVEGADGALPKLDLYWLAHTAARSNLWGVPVGLPGEEAAHTWAGAAAAAAGLPHARTHLQRLATLAQVAGRQALGLPTGTPPFQ